MAKIAYRDAVRDAMAEEMTRDSRVFLVGEEVAEYNGAYKCSKGLLDKFGAERVIDSPISEAGFGGMAIGAAMGGLRPIVEFMTWSFSFVAFDQIVNNAANMRYMSGGQIKVPIVFRGNSGGGHQIGATHSHAPEAIFASFPGLKVVVPAFAADAKGLLKTAIRDDNPVLVIENEALYGRESEVPDGEYLVPLGKANVLQEGADVTIVTHGFTCWTVLEAAQELLKMGIRAEVIDLRSIKPLDYETIVRSVRKTGRLVCVDETKPFAGVSAQIAAEIGRSCFDHLDAPILRVTALDVPMPFSPALEDLCMPNQSRIIEAVKEVVG
ncbi:MAG: Pyruvate/2-oxoglutarate dehydrogenase complex, beta subunit [Fibrobacterota bacterium]|jgi:pyruvate dehydrogenase E1 component beta subunit